MAVDVIFFRFINGLANQFAIIDWLAIFFAKYLPYFVIIFLFILWFSEGHLIKRWHSFFLTSLSLILSRGIIVEIIRFFFDRLRPEAVLENVRVLVSHSASQSFPSGHASFFFALGLSVFYFNKRWGIVYLIVSFLISLSRVFAGIHWPSDILAGALIGLGSAYLVEKILMKRL